MGRDDQTGVGRTRCGGGADKGYEVGRILGDDGPALGTSDLEQGLVRQTNELRMFSDRYDIVAVLVSQSPCDQP